MNKALNRSLSAVALLCAFTTSIRADELKPSDVAGMAPNKLVEMAGFKPFKKGGNKVFVPGFKVVFMTHAMGRAYAGNVLGSGTAKSKMEAYLAGVDYATMQSVTDAAYAQFLDQLKGAGMEVVPLSAFQGNAGFKQLQAANSAKPYVTNSQSVAVSPAGLPLWSTQYDKMLGGDGPWSGENSKIIGKLSTELGATAIYPTLICSFVSIESSGHSAFAKRASVEMTSATTIEANSWFWSQNGNDSAFGRITRWIALENDAKMGPLESSDNEAMVKAFSSAGLDIGPVSGKKVIAVKEGPNYQKEMLETIGGGTLAIVNGARESRK